MHGSGYETHSLGPAQIVHSWGDLESNVLRSEAVGRRLALCNMDWDRVSAQDLFGKMLCSCNVC